MTSTTGRSPTRLVLLTFACMVMITLHRNIAWEVLFSFITDDMQKQKENKYSCCLLLTYRAFNTLRPWQNGRHFPDDIYKCMFLNENVWISLKISLKFIPKGPINNIPALVQIMAWRRLGDKPLSEPIVVSLLTHICVTRPQWVIISNAFLLIKFDVRSYHHCFRHWLGTHQAASNHLK